MAPKWQGRRWCFTLNNFTNTEVEVLQHCQGMKCMIVGVAVGKNGTPNLQGYFRSAKKMRFNVVKKMLGPHAHIEQTRGTELDNNEYCRNDSVIAVKICTMNNDIDEKGCSSAVSDSE